MVVYEKIRAIIDNNEHFNIISHTMPDGDSIGSMIALAEALKQENKNVSVYSIDGIPRKYGFMDKGDTFDEVQGPLNSVFFILDCSDLKRTGAEPGVFENCREIINIDHHVTNEYFGTVNLVDPDASATGEILFSLLHGLNFSINRHIAEALYTAIITDTGLFKYENTSRETFRVAAQLLDYGVNPGMAQKIFDEYPLNYLLLLKLALSTLELWSSQRIACLTISEEMRLQCGASMETLEGIVNYAKNIEGVEIGMLIYVNSQGEVKVGLRSKNADVSQIAAHFSGGGHKKAAGFKVQGNLSSVKDEVLKIAHELIQ